MSNPKVKFGNDKFRRGQNVAKMVFESRGKKGVWIVTKLKSTKILSVRYGYICQYFFIKIYLTSLFGVEPARQPILPQAFKNGRLRLSPTDRTQKRQAYHALATAQ